MKQRIYMIGAGAIARCHAEALARSAAYGQTRPELYVADLNPAAAEAFAAQYPRAVAAPQPEAMLAEPARADDIVIIATPPAAHAELACLALRSGRHVLCEKPLAINMEEALRMLRTAHAAGRLLGCCSSRFAGLPAAQRVQAELAAGGIGRPYRAQWIQRRRRARSGIEYQPESRWFLDRSVSGGGTLMDWGPYDMAGLTEALRPVRVDVLHAWLAEPAARHPSAPAAPSGIEQHAGAAMAFHLPDGSRIAVQYERAACCHGEERSVAEVEGTDGALAWDGLAPDGTGELVRGRDRGGEPTSEYIALMGERLGAAHKHNDAASGHVGAANERNDGASGHCGAAGMPVGPTAELSAIPPMMDRPIVYFRRAVAGLPSPAVTGERAVFNFALLMAVYDCARTGLPQTVEKEAIR